MDLGVSDNVKPVLMKLRSFINEMIIPAESRYSEELDADRWHQPAVMQSMIERAKSEGLFNLFI